MAQAIAPVPADGTFTLVTVNDTATAIDPLLGQMLEVRLIDNLPDKSTEPYFDDVRLNFTAVPEPSGLALIGVGLVGLAGYAG